MSTLCHKLSKPSIKIIIHSFRGNSALCKDIIDRIVKEGEYISENGATVRQTALVFHFSKSTVHKDVTDRLKDLDYELYLKVKKVLELNLSQRHIRGGQATKKKYQKLQIVD